MQLHLYVVARVVKLIEQSGLAMVAAGGCQWLGSMARELVYDTLYLLVQNFNFAR
jgi:hypothetical protein